MIKKKQLNSLKRGSLDRQNANNGISQKKLRQAIKVDISKDKIKSNKNDKGNRPISQQRSKSKGNLQENIKQPKKSIYEVDQILMKKDLKQLLSKKGIRKSKETSIVPDILKKIEQNCRILKKIDYLQHNPSNKKTSKQSISNSKSFKYSHCNNRSEIPINKSRTKSRQIVQESARVTKKCRRSHQISNQHKIQDKIQSKVSSKVKNGSKPANLIQVVQQYKKIIDREEIRIQKSSKNTNYNSNQSRNSSSLHNSHGLYNILESISKNHKFEDSSSNMDKIQGLIKHQQNYIELNKSQKPHQVQKSQQQLNLKPLQVQRKRQSQIIQNQHHKNQDGNSQRKKPEQPHQSQAKFDSQFINNAFCQKENQKSTRFFERSKYYVQPIPPFKGKKCEDDSLIGCEIPLMENNIINDSELPQLQL